MTDPDHDAGQFPAPRPVAECRMASALCWIPSEYQVDGILWGNWEILHRLDGYWVDEHWIRKTPTHFVPFPPPVKIPAPRLTLKEVIAEISASFPAVKANSPITE